MLAAALELLSAALDTSGHIVIVGLKEGKPPIQRFFSPADYESAVAEGAILDLNGYNAYFATSTFVTDKSRKAENAQSVKNFKIDLDISADDDRKYATQPAALAAMKEFCTKYHFPKPVVVSSGYGLHCYWILETALDAISGKLYAEKFKQLCLTNGLKIDPTVTGDVARILRMPDTHNYKDPDDPKKVVLVSSIVDMHANEYFLEALTKAHADAGFQEYAGEMPVPMLGALPAHLQGVELDEATKNLLHRPKKFAIILKKIKAGEGCAQIQDIVENQQLQDEPRWRAGLSIAWACEDGQTAIHEMSNQYSGYDFDETVKKAELTPGPHKCSTFIDNWPDKCDGCKHRGKITSPIQLGEYVRKASAGSNVVMAMNKSVQAAPIAYTIPEYPYPYFRADGGGVFRRVPDDEDGGEEVYDKDFYLVERLRDEIDGYIMHFRLHHPLDGVLDFTLRTAEYSSPDRLRECLSKYGILVSTKKALDTMRGYIDSWYTSLEQRKEVATVKTQFGWTDENYHSFVIGDREITGMGAEKYSPTAPSIAPISKLFHKKGDFQEWKKVFNTYDRAGLEPHLFCALVGFASPLMAMTPYKGIFINAFSQESGSGKSTALQMAMSVWGDPNGLMLSYKDTALARFNRMGVYKNIPIAVDEVTKMSDDDMSDFLFSATQGRGRHRLTSSAMERINTITWASIVLGSSNKSFVESLQADKGGVEGELMRLLEPQFPNKPVMTKEEADEIFTPLFGNYGHAGEMFIEQLLECIPRARKMMAEIQKAIDTEAGLVGKERYWSAACASIETAGRLAVEFGIIDVDMDKLHKYIIKLLKQMRDRISATMAPTAKSGVLSEFLNAHMRDTLIVKSDPQAAGHFIVLEEAVGQLLIRYEQDTDLLYVTQSVLKKFLKERNVHLDGFLDEMVASNKVIGPKDGSYKRLASGTLLPSSNTRVYVFKMN